MEDILSPHRVITPEEEGIAYFFEETGTTYLENALGKAHQLYSAARRPVIADDSGLTVPALGGAPGVYSSRYGSPGKGTTLSATERNLFLLNNMKGMTDRRAHFICCLVLVLDEYRVFTVQETVSGAILEEPRGTGGFGYDPVFFLPELEKTVAELNPREKQRLSHRGRAGRVMCEIIRTLGKKPGKNKSVQGGNDEPDTEQGRGPRAV